MSGRCSCLDFLSPVQVVIRFSGFLVKVKVHKRIDIFYSLIGAVLFVMSGVFIIEEWQYAFRTRTRDLALLKGAVSIITGVLLAFDCVFTFKDD